MRTGTVDQRALSDRIEVGLVARQAGEVQSIAKFAAENRTIEDVVIINDRMNDRNLALRVRFREAEVVDGAGVEIAAIALAREVKL